jgi:hypothetical protein
VTRRTASPLRITGSCAGRNLSDDRSILLFMYHVY